MQGGYGKSSASSESNSLARSSQECGGDSETVDRQKRRPRNRRGDRQQQGHNEETKDKTSHVEAAQPLDEEKEKERAAAAEEEKRIRDAEEERKLTLEEISSVQEYIREISDRLELKAQLRQENSVPENSRPDEDILSRKDSTLKKNTAFVKKLRSFTESQKESILKDVDSLNLTKYTGEVASALVEAKLKMSDIPFMLQLCSTLHQRYADFAPLLLDCWKKTLLTSKDIKVSNPSKLRVDLRFFADLNTVGVFSEGEGLRILANQLQYLTVNDRDENANLGILTSFCRHCGDDWAGLIPRKMRVLAEKHNLIVPRSSVLSTERQAKCRNLLKEYYTAVSKHVTRLYKELCILDKTNRRLLQTKGELSQDRRERGDQLTQEYSKLHTNATLLADLVDDDPPELPSADENADSTAGDRIDLFGTDKEFEYDGDTALFEDEDTRLFYEGLTNLKELLPGIFYKESEHVEPEVKEEEIVTVEDDDLDIETVEKEMEGEDFDEQQQQLDDEIESSEREAGVKDDDTAGSAALPVVEDSPPLPPDEPDEDTNASTKLILDAFISSLPNCVNRDLIDKAALDFCMTLNTKANRRKLLRALFSVHRTRYDLLPFYSRLVATLHPVLPDLAREIDDLLLSEFRWHMNKKDQINIESKLKTVRFIGELVKFNMFPRSEALHCLKQLIANFSHHNIEMACVFLDTAGRFCYRSPDSHHRTKVYLDVMMRKKVALHMDARYVTMIENAYYYCNPPPFDGKINREPDLPPMHVYLRKLLYKDLNRASLEKVLKTVRKLDWDDKEFCAFAINCFTAVWNVRYNNIHCLASLLAGLAQFHEDIATAIVDAVLEDIRIGMEINDSKFNQRRQSVVKYIGELYSYRMVDSSVIFKTLFSLITFGVSLEEGTVSPYDPPDHLFRLSLVSTLLDTCGSYFYRGNSAKRLDVFLVYFQRYYWIKRSQRAYNATITGPSASAANPTGSTGTARSGGYKDLPGQQFPIRMEHMILDTIQALRPKLKVVESLEEAQQSVARVEAEYRAKVDRLKSRLQLRFVDTPGGGSLTDAGAGGGGLASIAEDAPEVDDLSQGMSQLSYEEEESGSDDEHTSEGRQHADTLSGLESDTQSRADDNKTKRPRLIECPEDQEVTGMLERIMTESLAARANEVVKSVQINIVLPSSQNKAPAAPSVAASSCTASESLDIGDFPSLLHPSVQQENGAGHVTSTEHDDHQKHMMSDPVDGPDSQEENTVPFTLMTRRGNKSQLTPLAVPKQVEFAARFVQAEAAERAEKARMKRLVLNMHEQQQEQEEQEWGHLGNQDSLLARQVPSNVNRERRVRYQHPKGAPDADAIFGSR